ncbi:MAG: sugar ABC transporter substrate-binding protein [Dehalococcoidia bacterium]
MNLFTFVQDLKYRRLVIPMLVLMSALAITTCSIGDDEADDTPVQIVYQDWRTDWFPPMVEELLDEFHAEHPNIRVFYTPDPDDLQGTMVDLMVAGTAPDVFQGCCTYFPSWAQQGHTLDLAPLIARDLDDSVISEWSVAQYQGLRLESGHQFAVPKYQGALGLYFNKDLFDELGLAYPDDSWTHDDYLSAMRQLSKDTDGDGSNDQWGSMIDVSWDRIQIHVNAWGGHYVDPADSASCVMDEQPALDALEWLRARMWDDDVMATFPDVKGLSTRDAFIQGKVAMVEDGSWALKDILTRAEFSVGIAPFPSGPVRRATLATTDGFGIYAGTEHPEEAWELVKFLISKRYGLAMADANFLQPALTSLVSDWERLVKEQFPQKAAEVDVAAFADGHVKGYSVIAEVFPDMATASALATEAWDRILTLGLDPTESIGGVCDGIEMAASS